MAAALLLCVSQVSVTALAADTVYVDCDVLRCRSTAEINDTNIVTNLYYGEKLQRVGTEGEWTVVLVDGKNRYVSTQYLSETAPTGKAAGNGGSAGGNAGGSSAASSGNSASSGSTQRSAPCLAA